MATWELNMAFNDTKVNFPCPSGLSVFDFKAGTCRCFKTKVLVYIKGINMTALHVTCKVIVKSISCICLTAFNSIGLNFNSCM